MTKGELRFAQKMLSTTKWLVWHDVPIQAKRKQQHHPDFVLLHPEHGILVVEIKDYHPTTLVKLNKKRWEIRPKGSGQSTTTKVLNPMEQVRQYAHTVADELKKNGALLKPTTGKLKFPWSYAVVLANISRSKFNELELGKVMDPTAVICKDELPNCEQLLMDAFPFSPGASISQETVDNVRGTIYPELQITSRVSYKAEPTTTNKSDQDRILPARKNEVFQVMDVHQEKLARNLGNGGHRVIHGGAGTGKTMLLLFRLQVLLQQQQNQSTTTTTTTKKKKPILVVCYNKELANQLKKWVPANRTHQAEVMTFHAWCKKLIDEHNLPLQSTFEGMARTVVDAIQSGRIPREQYSALLVDQAHDLRPSWLRALVSMVDPETNEVLCLFDFGQELYGFEERRRSFTFQACGLQARGRTTILHQNYRNTKEILDLACDIDGKKWSMPTGSACSTIDYQVIKPVAPVRQGTANVLICQPTPSKEMKEIASWMQGLHESKGIPYSKMAVLCLKKDHQKLVADALGGLHMPYKLRTDRFSSALDAIIIMTAHASMGLEFAAVAVPFAGSLVRMLSGYDRRPRYIAFTRPTHDLAVGVG